MGLSILIGFITFIVYIMFANKKKQENTNDELVQSLTNLYSNSVSYNNDVINSVVENT